MSLNCFTIMNIQDLIIETPMFALADIHNEADGKALVYEINEYTLRNIQLQIAKGAIHNEQFCIVHNGRLVEFDGSGRLSEELAGLNIADNLAMELFIATKPNNDAKHIARVNAHLRELYG